jgi:predicted DNA-binding protein (UPF0251 family)
MGPVCEFVHVFIVSYWAYAYFSIFNIEHMPRKKCARHINVDPKSTYFKPRGIPMNFLEEIQLELDEFEALRLKYHENLYQDQAAKKMRISRQTFGRILESANKKIADALINGKAIRIENELNFITSKSYKNENSYSDSK